MKGSLSQLPKEERPRERLITCGADSLSLAELLAICLGNGRKGSSVLALAYELLSRFESVSNLSEATLEELMEIKGVGWAKAVRLKAIFNLMKRRPRQVGEAKYPVSSPDDAMAFALPYLRNAKRECLFIMLRDVKGFVYHHEMIGIGTLSEVLVHPREVFYQAISHRAHSFILAHNHPSGDPTPSQQDLELTKLLIATSRIVGIGLDDHLMVGKVACISLWERGYFDRAEY